MTIRAIMIQSSTVLRYSTVAANTAITIAEITVVGGKNNDKKTTHDAPFRIRGQRPITAARAVTSTHFTGHPTPPLSPVRRRTLTIFLGLERQ